MMICHKTSVMRQRWDDRRQWSGRACPVMVWPDHRAVRGKPNWHACSATRNRLAAFADRPSRLPPPLSAVLSGEFSAARFVAAGNRRGFRLCYPDRPSLSQLFCRRRDRSWRQDRARTRARDQFRQRFAARVPGVRPIVADRFLAKWDPGYHPKFYTVMRNTLAAHDRGADLTPLSTG